MLDTGLLSALLDSPVRYIGVLGPRLRTERMLTALQSKCDTPLPGRERVHGPVGLDIGADTPETIALSILAEMQAALTQRTGGFLRDRDQPIHDSRPALVTDRGDEHFARSRGDRYASQPGREAESVVCSLSASA